ncbi:MAG: PASTA domain-containing protein [Bacteroidota bacterium]
MKAILQQLGERLKIYGKETYYFLTSMIFLRNFGGIIAMIGVLLLIISTWLHCYTNHGESLQVHDYVGMTLEEVVEKAKARSFEIIVADSIFLVDKPAHTVLEQSPGPLSRVKKNRKIYLTITKFQPDERALPDLTGGNDDYDQYIKSLSRISVEAQIVGRRFSNKLEKNTILEVIYQGDTITDQLKTGYKVPMGSELGLIVSDKSGGRVPIPSLLCKRYTAAEFLVQTSNLSIGSVVEDATVTDRASAFVWKQMPRYSPSGSIRIGAQIDLFLTQDRPDNCGSDGRPIDGNYSIENPRSSPGEDNQ